jgi:hypothetical protein
MSSPLGVFDGIASTIKVTWAKERKEVAKKPMRKLNLLSIFMFINGLSKVNKNDECNSLLSKDSGAF